MRNILARTTSLAAKLHARFSWMPKGRKSAAKNRTARGGRTSRVRVCHRTPPGHQNESAIEADPRCTESGMHDRHAQTGSCPSRQECGDWPIDRRIRPLHRREKEDCQHAEECEQRKGTPKSSKQYHSQRLYVEKWKPIRSGDTTNFGARS